MRRAPWIALLYAAACGTPAGTTTTPSQAPLPPIDQPPAAGVVLGSFAVYQPRSNVDAFPNAPDEAGWGSAGNTHILMVPADPSEASASAVARRGGPAPKLPPGTRMLYDSSLNSSGALVWMLHSLVVASKPILDATDVATCEIVGRPEVVISATKTESSTWPWVHITWTPAGIAKLQAVVDADENATLYLALGDDVVGDWPVASGHDGIGGVAIKIPQPDVRTAEAYAARNKDQLCPKGKP